MAAITLMLEIVNPRRVLTIGRIALCCPPGWKSQCQGDLLTTFSCPAGLRYECQYRLIRRLSGLIAEGNLLTVEPSNENSLDDLTHLGCPYVFERLLLPTTGASIVSNTFHSL